MTEMSLIKLVFTTLGVLLSIAFVFCLCCIGMKISDWRMKRYIMNMAQKKGVNIDIDKLSPSCTTQSPQSKDNCTIIVPEGD